MYKERKIAVVVPAYNEEKLIENTLASIPDYVDKIYVVDDGSIDKTSEKIAKFLANSRYIYIKHLKNKGAGASVASGYKKAFEDKMEIIAVMDGDNQMNSQYLTLLLDPIIKGKADYTKGNRLNSTEYRKGMSKWRFLGNIILTFLILLSLYIL